MKKNTTQLTENHRRGLSSSLEVVEKTLRELEDLMLKQENACCMEIINDVDQATMEHNMTAIREAKKMICEMTEKYGTSKDRVSMKRIINAKRTRIWEILTDSLSRRTKGYGEFPVETAGEYDKDIRKMMNITNRIHY